MNDSMIITTTNKLYAQAKANGYGNKEAAKLAAAAIMVTCQKCGANETDLRQFSEILDRWINKVS